MLSKESLRHAGILGLSLVFSFGGIFGCAFLWNSPNDGGRGGAIAVAISLFALFANRPFGLKIFEALTSKREEFLQHISELRAIKSALPDDRVSHVERLAKALEIWIRTDTAGQEKQNTFMALAAFIGTIAWGFGDWAAEFLHQLI